MRSYLTKKIEGLTAKTGIGWLLFKVYYTRKVMREINCANICEKDHVLCVGGGAIPCTAILIAQQTNANVTVVDHDSVMIRLAQSFVKRLGILNSIQFIHANGETFCYQPYSVIHVARQVDPQEEVITGISKTACEQTRIIIRTANLSYVRNNQEQHGPFEVPLL
ncbi:class I SAM-dependent methyltransferase [Amphibacillus jilinensis]|uniref:class I SAM-dependent methyltransferase n=1 Tax=Amphibacillus jilinensis TaxID=1216008 RepID=UPI0003099C93|nr:class I SAM-dependent methyltransferase [Amphibacillus jilinensis]